MPELPEVETIRLGLQKYLVGHRIVSVEVKALKLFQGDPKSVIGSKVIDVRRMGKGLIIDLDNKYSMAIHIKLTGQLIYRGDETKKVQVSKEKVGNLPSSATHIIFTLDKGAVLYYNDRRRFGWIKVLPTDQVPELPFFKGMGPEPFKDLTLEKFRKILSSSNTVVKPLIMDQKKIGGIGNIYANDALFLAGIDPRRKAKTITDAEAETLFEAILSVMEKSFRYGGASELNFVNALGQEGEYQNHALVYGKQGQKCPKDGAPIKKFFLGGRGTYVCPTHQK
jgi:formamidopyrimidine-DNA glycosylase